MRVRRAVLFTAASMAVVFGPPALAHIWLVTRGIHFKDADIDFGAPPSRYLLTCRDGVGLDGPSWRPGTIYASDADRYPEFDPARQATNQHLADDMLDTALKEERSGHLRVAAKVWRRMAHLGFGEPWFFRKRFGFYEAIHYRAGVSGALAYLRATELQNARMPGSLPAVADADPSVEPFVMYEDAYGEDDTDEFLRIQRRFPHSFVADVALIMAARTCKYDSAKELKKAEHALNLLASQYPHSRFRNNALGIWGRMAFEQANYRLALSRYRHQYRQNKSAALGCTPFASIIQCDKKIGDRSVLAADYLADWKEAREWDSLAFGLRKLRDTLDGFSAQDARAFWRLLRSRPELLTDYVEYRMDYTKPTPDLLSLVGAPNSPHLLSILAKGAYGMGRYKECRRLARRALNQGAVNDDAALSEFLVASCAKRSHLDQIAISGYQQMMRLHPRTYLKGGAKENLALLYEHTNRLSKALDIYRSLGYVYDFAYMVDVRMAPRQLRSYIEARPGDSKSKLLRFSLGLRYLRAHRFADAEAQFETLTKRDRRRLSGDGKMKGVFDQDIGIQDPLTTAHRLARLENGTRFGSPHNRSRALLAMARYYNSHRNLLLYNPSLWRGDRAYVIGFSWNQTVAAAADKDALNEHHWEHECLAQTYLLDRKAMALCQDEPKLHAQEAYEAACAVEKLADFSGYWRAEDHRHDLLGQSVLMMGIAARSPATALRKRAEKFEKVFDDERNVVRENGWDARHVGFD